MRTTYVNKSLPVELGEDIVVKSYKRGSPEAAMPIIDPKPSYLISYLNLFRMILRILFKPICKSKCVICCLKSLRSRCLNAVKANLPQYNLFTMVLLIPLKVRFILSSMTIDKIIPVIGMGCMVSHGRLRYTWNFLTPGVYSLITPAALTTDYCR